MLPPRHLPGYTCETIFPSGLFSIERHETIAYERFAYNTFRQSVALLEEQHLPLTLVVAFCALDLSVPAWVINCSVQGSEHVSGRPNRVVIEVPELLPVLMTLHAQCLCYGFFGKEKSGAYKGDPKRLSRDIQRFFDIANEAIRGYRETGVAGAIRMAYEASNVDMTDVDRGMDYYDTLSLLVATHEIAHVYLGQLKDGASDSAADKKAMELVADIVATEWLFRIFVERTPDSEWYREKRGFLSHREAIYENAKWAIESQFALLLLMGFAAAQASDGRMHFDGGSCHPSSFGRYWLQQKWLFTAIHGEYGQLLEKSGLAQLHEVWRQYFDTLCAAGVLSRRALSHVVSNREVASIRRAGQIAEERNIEELKSGLEFLKNYQGVPFDHLRKRQA